LIIGVINPSHNSNGRNLEMYDLVFRQAQLVDGTGSPAFRGDVAVEGDRIAAVGDLSATGARRVINLDGLALTPGFIDLHSHSDLSLPNFPRAESSVRQGITTQLTGNCGLTPYPVVPERADLLRAFAEQVGPDLTWDWQSAGDYAAYLENLPLATNVALQVGHGALRIGAMGYEQRAPTDAELALLEKLTAQAFEDGVLGLSSGLIYVPGSYSQTDELIALAKIARRYGGFYSSHIRGEGDTLLEAVEEAITIGREAGVPVQLSHHKATGEANWGKIVTSLGLIDAARENGQDVLADQYPYTAGSTTLTALLPQWALQGGLEAMRQRLHDPATYERIRTAIMNRDADTGARQFGPETIMICSVPEGPNRIYEGLMLTEIGRQRGEHPVDSALHLLASEQTRVQMIVFTMSEDDVKRVMRHKAVAVGTDGLSINATLGGKPHPRTYSTYPRVLAKYVREENVLTLEEAVRKMTSLPAQRLGRADMGLVRPGYQADLVVFDPENIAELSTYQEPHQYPAGISYVVVNGQIVIENGQDSEARAGRVLRRI
jgi:N-acyl-D-amino-acid deacylase